MNKKILSSALSILAAAALLVGGTYAVFTDSETNTGNTFANGELVVSLDGDNSDSNSVGDGPFFTVDGMVPGGEFGEDADPPADAEFACMQILNDGDMGMLFRSYATNVSENPPGTLFRNTLMVNVTLNHQDCPGPGGNYSDYGPGDAPTPIYTGALSGLVGEDNALDNLKAAFEGWPLEPGFAATYKVEVWLPFDADSDLQNAELTADMQVDATQFKDQIEGDVQW